MEICIYFNMNFRKPIAHQTLKITAMNKTDLKENIEQES